jgi:hypothetical protein
MGKIEDYTTEAERFRYNFKMRDFWKKEGLDAMIMPAYNHSGFQSKNADKMGNYFKWVVLWNLVHYPAGIVPVTEVL